MKRFTEDPHKMSAYITNDIKEIREVKIDVYGRQVTANGKLQFAFEVSSTSFQRFRQVFSQSILQ